MHTPYVTIIASITEQESSTCVSQLILFETCGDIAGDIVQAGIIVHCYTIIHCESIVRSDKIVRSEQIVRGDTLVNSDTILRYCVWMAIHLA